MLSASLPLHFIQFIGFNGISFHLKLCCMDKYSICGAEKQNSSETADINLWTDNNFKT